MREAEISARLHCHWSASTHLQGWREVQRLQWAGSGRGLRRLLCLLSPQPNSPQPVCRGEPGMSAQEGTLQTVRGLHPVVLGDCACRNGREEGQSSAAVAISTSYVSKFLHVRLPSQLVFYRPVRSVSVTHAFTPDGSV